MQPPSFAFPLVEDSDCAELEARPAVVTWDLDGVYGVGARGCLSPDEGLALAGELIALGRPTACLLATGRAPVRVAEFAARCRGAGLRVAAALFALAESADWLDGVASAVDELELPLEWLSAAPPERVAALARRTRLAAWARLEDGEEADVFAAARRVHALGVASWVVRFPVEVASGRALPPSVEVERQLHAAYEFGADLGLVVRVEGTTHHRRVVAQRQHRGLPVLSDDGGLARLLPLNDGRGLVFVAADGTICPSAELRAPCGNVRTHSLSDVYRYHPTFRALRDVTLLRGRCASCEFRAVCGGRRARAQSASGRLFGSDPLCSHEPGRGY